MLKISAGEFRKNSGKYQDIAQRAPITITKHDRPSLVLISFDEYQRITGKTRRAIHVTQLTDEDVEAIASTRMSEKYSHLDDEMED